MTAVLMWKEYRQQRTLWLAIAGMALVLIVVLAQLMHSNSTSGWKIFQDRRVTTILGVVVSTMAMVQGLLSGAMLLAGDKEDGTLSFLDRLTGQRRPLFMHKLAAGFIFTLSQSLLLAGVAVSLGFAIWQDALWVPLLGFDGLVWGLLAGALCRSVFVAVLFGLVLLVSSSLPTMALISVLQFFTSFMPPARALLSAGAIWVAYRIYCRNDFSRRQAAVYFQSSKPSARVTCNRALLWLVFRQGRWILCGGLVGAVILGRTIHLLPLYSWPAATLALGVVFGLAAFAFDQNDGLRFLGAQRFPAGRI